MNAWAACLVFVCVTFHNCFGRDSKLPEINIPDQGAIVGVESSKLRVQKIIAYYGIPYAQPPVDNLRFAPPVTDPLPQWESVKQETTYKKSCYQTEKDYKESEKPFLQLLSNLSFTMSEDCLYLNIFVPYGDVPSSKYATIIWFHPGNFTTGTPAMWNPHTIVYRQRVIVVTVAWRLNIMGFLTTMDGEAPGNFGLMDQQAAMKWVKNNIKLFGGNPDNICLMGYGTGATSIGIHMINSGSRGLFHKAIAMSGDFLSPSAVKRPEEDKGILDQLAESFLCNRKPTSKLIECLRNIDAEVLVDQTSNINWGPLLDVDISNSTPFLMELPIEYFERDSNEKVPLLTGYTSMEQALEIESIRNITSTSTEYLESVLYDLVSNDIPVINTTDATCSYNFDQITDAVLFFYGPATPIKDADKFREIVINLSTERQYAAPTILLATYTSNVHPTYVYRFDIKPSTPAAINHLPEWATVPHLYDLIYVWGLPYWANTEQEWDIRDKRISDTIMSFWTNFAKTSNPTENSIYPVTWNAFSKDNPGILIIDGNFNMSDNKNLNYKAFEFWNRYYPKVKILASQCCEVLDGGSSFIHKNSVAVILLHCLLFYFCVQF